MKFTFIYPYKEINSRSLWNDTLTMLEYTSLRFANYLACLGCEILICSEDSQAYVHDNISYDSISNIKSMDIDNKTIDYLMTIDTFDYLDIPAQKKYSWLSSSIDNISLRKNSVNIINYDVEIITFKGLGGDFEIPYPPMEIHSNFGFESDVETDSADQMDYEKPYALITTNPLHGLEEIVNNWDNSLIDLYIVSKTLDNKSINHLKISEDRENIKVIPPKNSDRMVMIIKNARFYILPELPHTVFNSFAILSQYYGVPTLSYNYNYNHILHKNNMGGVNVATIHELIEYVRLLSHDNDMLKELSHQASVLRYDLDMEKIFMELAEYFHVDSVD